MQISLVANTCDLKQNDESLMLRTVEKIFEIVNFQKGKILKKFYDTVRLRTDCREKWKPLIVVKKELYW